MYELEYRLAKISREQLDLIRTDYPALGTLYREKSGLYSLIVPISYKKRTAITKILLAIKSRFPTIKSELLISFYVSRDMDGFELHAYAEEMLKKLGDTIRIMYSFSPRSQL